MSDLSSNTATAEAATLAVMRHAARTGRLWHTPSELARVTGLDRCAVERALRQLAAIGEAERAVQEVDRKLIASWRAASQHERLEW